MSPWQVYKFGGSSLGAAARLPVVLRRVAEAERPLALVVRMFYQSSIRPRASRSRRAGPPGIPDLG